jgi:hypothetical protein
MNGLLAQFTASPHMLVPVKESLNKGGAAQCLGSRWRGASGSINRHIRTMPGVIAPSRHMLSSPSLHRQAFSPPLVFISSWLHRQAPFINTSPLGPHAPTVDYCEVIQNGSKAPVPAHNGPECGIPPLNISSKHRLRIAPIRLQRLLFVR